MDSFFLVFLHPVVVGSFITSSFSFASLERSKKINSFTLDSVDYSNRRQRQW